MDPHIQNTAIWTMPDAKDRLHELARRALSEGPQRVAMEDGHSLLVVATDTLVSDDRAMPFLDFRESLGVDGIDLTRDRDGGRDVDL